LASSRPRTWTGGYVSPVEEGSRTHSLTAVRIRAGSRAIAGRRAFAYRFTKVFPPVTLRVAVLRGRDLETAVGPLPVPRGGSRREGGRGDDRGGRGRGGRGAPAGSRADPAARRRRHRRQGQGEGVADRAPEHAGAAPQARQPGSARDHPGALGAPPGGPAAPPESGDARRAGRQAGPEGDPRRRAAVGARRQVVRRGALEAPLLPVDLREHGAG